MKNIAKCIWIGIIGCNLIGCSANTGPEPREVTMRFITTERSLKRVRRLDISLELPRDVIDLDTYKNREYQGHLGCTSVNFELMRLRPKGMESGPLTWGEVRIYDPQQELGYREITFYDGAYTGVTNRRITKYDTVVKLDTTQENRFGYPQKVYRLDHKDKASGKVFRAMIVRASYASSPVVNRADEELITQILKSIRFE